MKNVSEIVQRIEKQYIGDDCIQIMIPYRNAVTVLNQEGILFHSKIDSDLYINKYLQDERRKSFPYSNIPTHYSKMGFIKYSYANQLFDFKKPYIRVEDGIITESFAIKDNNQALLINKILYGDKTTKYMTYDELLNFINKSSDGEEIYYLYLNGAMHPDNYPIYPSKEEIYSYIKNKLMKNVKDFREYQQFNPGTTVGKYLKNNPYFLNYIEEVIKKLDLSLIDFNLDIGDSSPLLIVRINNDNITIQCVNTVFVREDTFKVDIYDIPVTKFTLEQLKYVPKINISKEPRIPLRLNPSVTKQDIQEAKQMVKTLRR